VSALWLVTAFSQSFHTVDVINVCISAVNLLFVCVPIMNCVSKGRNVFQKGFTICVASGTSFPSRIAKNVSIIVALTAVVSECYVDKE